MDVRVVLPRTCKRVLLIATTRACDVGVRLKSKLCEWSIREASIAPLTRVGSWPRSVVTPACSLTEIPGLILTIYG